MIRSRLAFLVPAFLALAALPTAMAGCSIQIANGDGCLVNGVWHAMNDSWKDDCNSCACNDDGTWGCTAMACVVECTDSQGNLHFAGDTFPAPDGCNTCSCDSTGQIACTEIACAETCTWNGQTYQLGDTFPAGDGCNSCSCEAEGVACTLIACVTCTYAGQMYSPGASFPALDGCNTCTCDDTGQVGCTKIACTCDPAKEWWRSYVATSPAECQVIDYACPPNTTMFGNDCGCGCEQDASCPQWFDCMPPNPCDVQKIKEQCPYSGIAF